MFVGPTSMTSTGSIQFTVVAHRGHQGQAPENTLEAFSAAVAAGFPHVETDVQLTQDGVVVVLHDEVLGRTVSGSGAVANHTWQQLLDRDAGNSWLPPPGSAAIMKGPWRVPTLRSLLQQFHGQLHLHLELKSKQPDLPAAVAVALKQCGWVTADGCTAWVAEQQQHQDRAHHPSAHTLSHQEPYHHQETEQQQEEQQEQHQQQKEQHQLQLQEQLQELQQGQHQFTASSSMGQAGSNAAAEWALQVPGLTITSFHLQQLAASKQLLPGVRHAWLVQDMDTDEVYQAAAAAGVTQLCPRAGTLTREGVQRALQRGYSLRAWGLKTEQDVIHAVHCGAQGGTADHPHKCAALIQHAIATQLL